MSVVNSMLSLLLWFILFMSLPQSLWKKKKLFLYSTNVVCVNRKIDRNKCPASLCGTVSVCLCDSVRERESND